jgi:predicted nucleic acid-binding protein
MNGAYRAPYLDSAVYIEAIKGQHSQYPERSRTAERILRQAEAGGRTIVASTFLWAEVIRDRGEPPISEEQEGIVDRFLLHGYISWVELGLGAARDARQLARRLGVKPADAVHLGAAVRGKADVFFTWDGDVLAKTGGELDGMPVVEPYIVEPPQPELDLGTN